MNKAQLATGSFDLAYTKEGKFVFIELNPAGIFENVSYYGNYYIEREFAKFLISCMKKEKTN